MQRDPFCKLYVDYPESRPIVAALVASLIGGSVNRNTITSEALELYVDDNDEHDPHRASDASDGFLYYRYMLDMEPRGSFNWATYIQQVRDLRDGLRAKGASVVVACDFEDDL